MKPSLFVAALAVIALALSLISPAPVEALEVGDSAPDFELADVFTGEKLKLSSLHGKYVVLDFWATWCGPCRAVMESTLKPVWERIGDRTDDWTLISVGTNWNRETAQKQADYARANGYKWTFLFDETGSTTRAYDVEGIPTIVLVDKDGKVKNIGHEAIHELYRLLVPLKPLAERAVDFSGNSQTGKVEGFAGEVAFRVQVEADGDIELRTEAEFDTILELYNAQGEKIAENDDISRNDTNSLIVQTVRAGETYFAVVKGYGDASGEFTLFRNYRQSMRERAVDFTGQPVQSELTNEISERIYRLRPERAGAFTIRTTGDDLDTVLVVYDANGEVIAENDDEDAENNIYTSRIDIELQANTDYFVVVRGFDGSAGRFGLEITAQPNR